MSIEFEAPPVVPAPVVRDRQHSYLNLFTALRSQHGEWCSIPLTEIAGKTNAQRQTRIHSVARQRGLKVQTTIQGEKLYARLIVSLER
jgi:hypothetical protein